MKTKKKVLLGILSACLVVSIAAGFTLSYFNDSAEVTNKFVVGANVDIDIDEPSWPEVPPVVTPGISMIKDPTVTAKDGDSYMRMVVTIKDLGTDAVITDQTRVNKILETVYNDTGYSITNGVATTPNIVPGTHYKAADISAYAGFNTTNFALDTTRGETGVYYYNYKNTATNDIFKTTTPENTVVLFTNVVVPSDWVKADIDLLRGTTANADGKLGYQIIVSAQAIQTIGFANSTEAFAALDDEIAKI